MVKRKELSLLGCFLGLHFSAFEIGFATLAFLDFIVLFSHDDVALLL